MSWTHKRKVLTPWISFKRTRSFNFWPITMNVISFKTIVLKIYESQTHLTKDNGRMHCDPTPNFFQERWN
jgi:hypothetical protein